MGGSAQGALGAVVLVGAALAVSASSVAAQTKEPLGRFVADVRAASAGLPTLEGWTPIVPDQTDVPARTLGFEFGAQVHVARFGFGALGVGATWLRAKGTASPPALAEGQSTPPDAINPTVTTRLTSFSPQLSLNFGHSLGWSYLSTGLGWTSVHSEATAAPGSSTRYTPFDSGWVSTFNYGGGARWFLNDHVGVGFDLRFYRLRPVEATSTQPAAAGTQVWTASAGLTFK